MKQINLRILEIRKKLDMTQEEFAKNVGTTRSILSQIEISKANPTLELVISIANRFCNGDYGQLLSDSELQKKKTFEKQKKIGIPLISIEAVAGFGNGDMAVLSAEVEHYIVPEFRNADFMIRIGGDSMSPSFINGDIVACKKVPTETFIQWGKIYVMDTEQGVLCKRIFESERNDFVKVYSDNKESYPAFEMEKNKIRSLSIILGLIRAT